MNIDWQNTGETDEADDDNWLKTGDADEINDSNQGKRNKRDMWLVTTRLKHNHNCDRMVLNVHWVKPGFLKLGPGGPLSLQGLAPTLIKHTWES